MALKSPTEPEAPPTRRRRRAAAVLATLLILQPLLVQLFLTLIPVSGPSAAKYWWLKVDLKDSGEVALGALGWCLNGICESTGYGYSIDQPKSAGMVPGVLNYHLFVVIMHALFTFAYLVVFYRLRLLILERPKVAMMMVLLPPASLLLQIIMLALDSSVLSKINGDEMVAKVHAMPTFWLTIPAFAFTTTWMIGSIICWRQTLIFARTIDSQVTQALEHFKEIEEAEAERIEIEQVDYAVFPLGGPPKPARGFRGMFSRRRESETSDGYE